MSRRSRITGSQRVDLAQRRRTRSTGLFSEQPVPLQAARLPGGGEGGSWDPGWPEPPAPPSGCSSWLSPRIGWLDPKASWLTESCDLGWTSEDVGWLDSTVTWTMGA
jgi:hypothetical protein